MIVGYFRGSFGISHCCRHDTRLTGILYRLVLIGSSDERVCLSVGGEAGGGGGGGQSVCGLIRCFCCSTSQTKYGLISCFCSSQGKYGLIRCLYDSQCKYGLIPCLCDSQ